MDLNEDNKQAIIQRLLVAKQKAHVLEISLRFKGKAEEADQLSEKISALSDEIDNLIGQLMLEWSGKAESIIDDITTRNTSLQTAIRNIQKDLSVAQNIVKAIGYVDDLVVIASKIASKM